jgi:tetratricopeptide (TPR) repeat protein
VRIAKGALFRELILASALSSIMAVRELKGEHIVRRLSCLFVVLVLAGCSGSNVQPLSANWLTSTAAGEPGDETPAVPDSTVFKVLLEDFQALPAEEKYARRRAAAPHLEEWHTFEEIAFKRRDRRERAYMYDGLIVDRRRLLTGVAQAYAELSAVPPLDPTSVEAWAGMGHLSLEVGDLAQARRWLERALQAARERAAQSEPVDADLLLSVHRDRAWVLRDLGWWEEGLVAVREGLEKWPGDPDLVLIKGLLLAGAGRLDDALGLAARMPPLQIRDISGQYATGLLLRPSDYANQWIRSQAYLATGDLEMAFHVFGERRRPDEPLSIFEGRLDAKAGATRLPHQRRFWNDVGLVAELRGDPAAMDYYVAGYVGSKYRGFYPTSADARGPLVLDVPDQNAPFFVSFGHRHYLVGSRFGYVAYQMNAMSLALFPEQRRLAAAEALAELDILERWRVRPDDCRALRGRVYYRQDRFDQAWPELKAARDSFATRGEIDARTGLLLGLLEMRRERFAQARGYLEESLRKDPDSPVTWRMAGVVYANLELADDALAAMDRAVALEPHSLVAYYNRGLLRLQLRQCAEALPDLETAWRLDPGNEDVQRLLQVAGACVRDGDAEPRLPAGLDPAEPVVRVAGAAAPRFEADPDLLLDHLQADLERFFAPLAEPAADATLRAARLDSASSAHPDNAQLRKAAALAWLDLGEETRARTLLVPHWGTGLSPLEEVMLLWIDSAQADRDRTRKLTADALAGELVTTNPYVWRLVVAEIQRDPEPWGPDAQDRVVARWFDYMNEFSGNSVLYWTAHLRQELAVARAEDEPDRAAG